MKKGFTIVEIIATITIVAVVSILIMVGYQAILNQNYESIYKSKIKEIEVAGLKYGDANLDSIKKEIARSISISTLIEEGYIEGDNGDKKKIIDPRRNKEYIEGEVLIFYQGKEIKAQYNAKSITVNLRQDKENLTSTQIKLQAEITVPENITDYYCIYELNDLKSPYEEFTSGELRGADCNEYTFNNVDYFIDVISGKPIITHTATIKIYDNLNREIKQTITAKVKEKEVEALKIEAYYATDYPEVKIKYNIGTWTNQDIIIVGENTEEIQYLYSFDMKNWMDLPDTGYKQSQNGDIPIYIRKKENGIIGSDLGIIRIKIDKIPPTCTNDGDSTTWTKYNRGISKGCNDTLSGCFTPNLIKIFDTTTQTATITAYTIADRVGNKKTCPSRIANVYVDKTPPTCTNDGDSTTWTNEDRSIRKGCNDAHSGCETATNAQTFKSTTKTKKITAYTIADKVGNLTECPSRIANVYVDKTPPYYNITLNELKFYHEDKNKNELTPIFDNNPYCNSHTSPLNNFCYFDLVLCPVTGKFNFAGMNWLGFGDNDSGIKEEIEIEDLIWDDPAENYQIYNNRSTVKSTDEISLIDDPCLPYKDKNPSCFWEKGYTVYDKAGNSTTVYLVGQIRYASSTFHLVCAKK